MVPTSRSIIVAVSFSVNSIGIPRPKHPAFTASRRRTATRLRLAACGEYGDRASVAVSVHDSKWPSRWGKRKRDGGRGSVEASSGYSTACSAATIEIRTAQESAESSAITTSDRPRGRRPSAAVAGP